MIDPITIASIVGSVAGGIGNVLSRKKAKKYTIKDLIDSGYKPMDTSLMKNDIRMDANNLINDKRNTINEKQISRGYDPVGAIGSYDKDVSNSMFGAFNKVDTAKAQEDRRINDTLMNLNMNEQRQEDNQESPMSSFLGGGIQTFNAISGIRSALRNKPEGNGDITIQDLINFLKSN